MVADVAARTAIVVLREHPNADFIVGALLTAGIAIAAQAEAHYRARCGQRSDLADVLATALAFGRRPDVPAWPGSRQPATLTMLPADSHSAESSRNCGRRASSAECRHPTMVIALCRP